jgi:hypothetical protein
MDAPCRRRSTRSFVYLLPVLLALIAAAPSKSQDKEQKRPSLSLKASPIISFSPARIFLVAELRGGTDDQQELYCAGTEWDWGDGTRSESSYDCEPYEAGKSEIRRRFATEHVYYQSGNYRIHIRLKKKDKVVMAANTSVQVRAGLREIGGAAP